MQNVLIENGKLRTPQPKYVLSYSKCIMEEKGTCVKSNFARLDMYSAYCKEKKEKDFSLGPWFAQF